MDAFQQLQVLSMLCLALMVAPGMTTFMRR